MPEEESKGRENLEKELAESIAKLVIAKINAQGLDEEIKKRIEEKVRKALEKRDVSGKEREDALREYWEVKAPLMAVSEFLRDLKEPVADLIKAITGGLSGDQVGKDVAQFYKHLIEAGIDRELAREITLEYFRKRTSMADLGSMLMKMFSKGKGFIITGKPHQEEKEIEEEEEEREEGES